MASSRNIKKTLIKHTALIQITMTLATVKILCPMDLSKIGHDHDIKQI